jgi:hypothetical protein
MWNINFKINNNKNVTEENYEQGSLLANDPERSQISGP